MPPHFAEKMKKTTPTTTSSADVDFAAHFIIFHRELSSQNICFAIFSLQSPSLLLAVCVLVLFITATVKFFQIDLHSLPLSLLLINMFTNTCS